MGNCLTLDTNQRNSRIKSREIDKTLQEYEKQRNESERNVVKILILGTGESGKSTLIKQMKIIHSEGYTKEELADFRMTILENLIISMKCVLMGMRFLRITYEIPENKERAQQILTFNNYQDDYIKPNVVSALKNLWADKGVRDGVARGFEYELNDSALYFFKNINRITSEKYIPNTTDVLRSRVRTIGVVETQFKVDDLLIKMFDVGGQRSERKKWIQCFDDVKTLLFVVAISEYDMTLIEDHNRNRLKESFQLFSSVFSNNFFSSTATLLFLNKLDLFRDKILFSDRQLRHFIPEYLGPDKDCDAAALFIQHKFDEIFSKSGSNKSIYSHFITATDTSHVKQVFQSVLQTIVRENTRKYTLI